MPVSIALPMQTQLFRVGQQAGFQKKLCSMTLSRVVKGRNTTSNKTVCEAQLDLAKHFGVENLLIECPCEAMPAVVFVVKLTVMTEGAKLLHSAALKPKSEDKAFSETPPEMKQQLNDSGL